MTHNVDYVSTYFKYPVPSPINSEPTNKSLNRLNTKLRANRSGLETDLSGGDYSYLELMFADVEYEQINPTPDLFVAHCSPAALVIDSNLTAIEAVDLEEVHKEATSIYRECKNVEKTLLRHTQIVLEDKYIEYLIIEYTGLIK